MFRRNSSLFKFAIALIAITLVCFLLMVLLVGTLVIRFSRTEQQTVVHSNALHLRNFVEQECEIREPTSLWALKSTIEPLNKLAASMVDITDDLAVFVIDLEKRTVVKQRGEQSDFELSFQPNDAVIAQIRADQSVSADNAAALGLPESEFFSILPVHYRGQVVGMVVACVPADQMTAFVFRVLRIIGLLSLITVLLIWTGILWMSKRLSDPIKQIGHATKEFARGHLDVRVPVKGNNEFAEMALAFNSMAASLQNLEETRRSFIANVSHDLRTPMTTISGFIDGILDGKIPKEEQEHYLSIIASEIRRLSRLVSTLLDMTRIQAGERKFVMTSFDICEIARKILISFEQRINDKRLNVLFDAPDERVFVFADPDAIYQVFYNLCDNAVKFSREGGAYRISIVVRGSKVFASVYNDGAGIAEEDLPHVFDRFYKSDKSRGLDKTGMGLGLFISKMIIDSHGEEIWVKSKQGSYCEFVFTLTKATQAQLRTFHHLPEAKDKPAQN